MKSNRDQPGTTGSTSPADCGICLNTYNTEENCPRTLPCTHVACHHCINELIKNNTKLCPFCRRKFRANSSQNFPMNRTVLDFMEYIEKLEKNKRLTDVGGENNDFAMTIKAMKERNIEIAKTINADCRRNDSQIMEELNSNTQIKEELLQARRRIQNEISPKLNEADRNLERLIKKIDKVEESMKKQQTEMITKETQITLLDVRLNSASGLKNVATILEEAEDTNNRMKVVMKDLEKHLVRLENIRLHATRVAKETDNKLSKISEVLRSNQEEEVETEPVNTVPGVPDVDTENGSEQNIMVDDLRRMNNQVKKMIQDNKIFAIKHLEGRSKASYGKISYSPIDNRLLLHHLREINEERLPSNSKFIQFDDVMKMVDNSRTLFLEFGVGEKRRPEGREEEVSLGKTFIRVISDSNLSLNFTYLCTGEKGPSYANTNILELENKGKNAELVHLGDYETNDGHGGKGLVPGVDWLKEAERDIHQREDWFEGLVGGLYTSDLDASRFDIYTIDNLGIYDLQGVFGEVKEGLHILQDAITNYPSINEVKIIDCGIVLSQ